MTIRILAVTSLLLVGIIAGCGSSSMISSPSAVTGKVADGYLAGATVFLDKNGNYQLDVGEPSTTTDANGAYTLNVDPADVGKYPIVALAIKGVTIDKDTNLPVQNSYILSMHKDSVSGTVNGNFISPMSTQLREMMETGKFATMQQSMQALSAQLGMPAGTNMLADYIDGKNPAMHTAASNMATLMGGQMPQVLGPSGSATSVDVNRYRGMMGAIFSNISSIKGSHAQTAMTGLMTTMTSNLADIKPGQPFRNMSASFRSRMTVGGTGTMPGGGMMGSGVSSSSGGSMMGR